MKLLIVEDDRFKRDSILAKVDNEGTVFQGPKLAGSVQAGIKAIIEDVFDLLILDMALPSHDLKPGAGPSTNLLSGGIEIIMQLSYLQRNDKVVVLTQYPEIEIDGVLLPLSKAKSELATSFYTGVIDVILYDNERVEWADRLNNVIRSVK
jgi:CheY-like chemotaxis protein